jgi:GAF domain-containing protein
MASTRTAHRAGEPTGALVCQSVWDSHRKQNIRLDEVSVAGNAYSSGEPQWIADILSEPPLRGTAAAKARLHTACAFPIGSAGQLFGVMEFFSARVIARDAEVAELFSDISVRIHSDARSSGGSAIFFDVLNDRAASAISNGVILLR